MPTTKIPFNKAYNTLRRQDEAEPVSWRPSDEFARGGFSAEMQRTKRQAKSKRKTAARLAATRRRRRP
jgi:hypothetical protein